jgi:hypothetical protein
MAVAKSAIYECTSTPSDFPPLVVILMDGKAIGCQPVLFIQAGEAVLAEMMDGLSAMATREASSNQ